MTDRELLELAAKAAGIVFDRSPHNGGPRKNPGFTLTGDPVLDWHNFVIWNPLTDDGDALRLAVKLAEQFPCSVIGVFNRGAFPYASASVVHHDGAETYIEQDVADDPLSATRRAIVRAAAEIGRTMP